MNEPINVGLGMHAISRNPEDVLVAYGLGSCIGVVMIDPISKISGLLHAVLPRTRDGLMNAEVNNFKFVDTGIESLLSAMINEGVIKSRLTVKLVGGANMLTAAFVSQSFTIGERNIEEAYATLDRLNLPILAAEVGGQVGRTVKVFVSNCRVTVRVAGEKEHEI